MDLITLWRHPVKSLRGEMISIGVIDHDGMRGDRCWGIRDEASGKILTARREPRLLAASSLLDDDEHPVITLPGEILLRGAGQATDSALSAWLGRPVTLATAAGAAGGQAEFFADATDDSSEALEWTMPAGRFVDAMPLLILTTASLRAAAAIYPGGQWDHRRFRPNLLVEADSNDWVEDAWCGKTIHVGDVELTPQQLCVRCTMVTRPQSTLQRDVDIFKTLARHHGATLGVWATVRTPGTVRIGDPVEVVG